MNYVAELMTTFEKYYSAKQKLGEVLTPVAKQLGFDDIVDIVFVDTQIGFLAEWNGGHGNHNKEWFYFPIEFIEEGNDTIYGYLQTKRDKEQKERNIEAWKRKNEIDMMEYKRLREKFGGLQKE